MAHLRFFNSEYSQITGSIKRAQQLIRSQYAYLEEHPQLAPRHYRRLRMLAQHLETLKKQHPGTIDSSELNDILNELSSIVGNLQRAA